MLEGKLTLEEIASSFIVKEYVPAIDELPEGLSWEVFLARYGAVSDRRFQVEKERINRRIQDLKAYQKDAD